jgi:hypothetical protein
MLISNTGPNETDRYAMEILRNAGISIPDAVLGTGNIDKTSVAIIYSSLYNAMTSGYVDLTKKAAKWMVSGTDSFDVCDFEPTKTGPFPLTCIQREFRQAGCQPAGAAHPSSSNTGGVQGLSWSAIGAKFKNLYTSMKSTDSETQRKATKDCLGVNFYVSPDIECVKPKAKFYENCDYQGAVSELEIGEYDLNSMGIRNDSISSVRVPSGLKVILYEHGNFQGRTFELTSDTPCLVNNAFNDVASGVKVVPNTYVPVAPPWDVVNKPYTTTNTWNELNQVCEGKGKRLCSSKELCSSNQPIANMNIFGGADNWMAVNDKQNEWLTYNTADNRLCKTHTQVVNYLPAWGTSKSPNAFYRAAKCCSK